MPTALPTTGIDRQLTGSDFNSFFAFQTAYGSVNAPLVFQPLRKGSGGIKYAPTYTQSPERPADREGVAQVQDIANLDATISSGVSLQSFGLFRASICGVAETTTSQTATTFSTTATTVTGPSGWTNDLAIGDWFFAEGFTAGVLNIAYQVVSKTATAVTTYPTPAVVEAAGASVTIKSFKTVTGDTPTLLTMQDRAPDDTAVGGVRYRTAYNGFINTATMTIPETGPLTYETTVQFEKLLPSVESVVGQSDLPATTDDALSAVQNIEQFIVNNQFATCSVKSMSFQYSNNNQVDNAAGCGQRFGLGQISLSGSIVARSPKSNPFVFRNYFENGTNITGTGVVLNFGSGKKAVIIMDRIKITEHEQSSEANVIASSSCTFNAEKGQYGKTLRIYTNFN
jgi:hypothetical protein